MESVLSHQIMATEEIEWAYRQATGKWVGCDWPTKFGETGLNLDGLKASQALLLARATSGGEQADWQAAVPWLTCIEQDAGEAEAEGEQAVTLAISGKLPEALAHAQRACAIEASHHGRLIWEPLCLAIEAALDERARRTVLDALKWHYEC